jgi:23S rRNA (uridine2552-2'-O)-methyltransferase
MKRTRTSNAWLREHVNDTFVQRAKAEGYRSRAAFKLMEIDDRDHLIRPGEVVVDLGATPGGWSQVVAKRKKGMGGSSRLICWNWIRCMAWSSSRGIFAKKVS